MNIIKRIARRFGFAPIGMQPKSLVRSVGFDAGKTANIFNDWTTSTISIDTIISNQQKVLVARSRDLAHNCEYAIGYLRLLRNNVLGENGIQLRMAARDEGAYDSKNRYTPGPLDDYANNLIMQAWVQWCEKENCTVTQDMTWLEVCQQALRTIAVDGELFCQIHRNFSNEQGFALQMFETEHVPVEESAVLQQGGQIRLGIQLDKWGKPVAYMLRKRNPNDNLPGANVYEKTVTIPADSMVHPYVPPGLNATRGLPWIVSAAKRMNHLEAYENAEVVAARISAEKMGFFERTGDSSYEGEQQEDGSKLMESEPGSFQELPQGLKLAPWDPQHPNANYDGFMSRALRGIAVGWGVSYNILGDDMSSVNFSSGRLGLQEPRENYKTIQRWFIDDWCMPIFKHWLAFQVSNGIIRLSPAKLKKYYSGAVWRARRWAYIEPTKDTEAAIKRINSGQTSLSKELAEQGIDRDELLDEIVSDKAAMESRGLEFSEIYGKKQEPQQPNAPVEDEEDDDEEETLTAKTSNAKGK